VVAVTLASAAAVGWNVSSSSPRSPGQSAILAPASPAPTPARAASTLRASLEPLATPRTAAPSPGAKQPSPAEPSAAQILKASPLYFVNLKAGTGVCRIAVRPPQPPLKDSELAPYVRRVVGCLTTVLRAPLAKENIALTAPRVRSFKGSVATPCGKLSATAAPAYYCAATATLYWPVSADDGRDAFSYVRLGYVALTAHEFGHHVQAAAGIVNAYGAMRADTSGRARLALTRRLELQAECFAGVFLAYTENSLHFTGQDRYELSQWHASTGDEDPPAGRRPDHGTSRAQLRWLWRGLAGADFGRCNTWSASASSVT
jgi:predicted metalloprotease